MERGEEKDKEELSFASQARALGAPQGTVSVPMLSITGSLGQLLFSPPSPCWPLMF